MKYLKVFTDFAEDLEPLSDVEVGRLFRAMLQYAETGTAPDLKGNERYVWASCKKGIDREAEHCSMKAEAGRQGGRPRKADESRKKQEKADESRKKQTKAKKADKDNDKDNDKDISPQTPQGGGLDVAMDEFAEFRKKIRKPLTEKAKELTLAELEKLAPGDESTKVAIIEQSIQRGWQGVFPLKEATRTSTIVNYGGIDAYELFGD